MYPSDEFDDDRIDALLRGVASPVGLRSRLLAVSLDDDELRERLCHVTIPFGLKFRLRRIAAGPRWTMRRMAAAAGLLVVLGGWYAMLLGSIVGLHRRQVAQLAAHVEPISMRSTPYAVPPELTWRVERQRFVCTTLPIQPPHLYRPVLDELAKLVASIRMPVVPSRTLPTDRLILAAAGSGSRALETSLFGSASAADGLPELNRSVLRIPRGIAAPLNPRERRFLRETGVFPFVTPREFATSTVSPSFDTASFELAREYLNAAELPPPDQVRVEEFLAACDFGYVRLNDRTARLITAGGMAPWNPPAAQDAPTPSEATRLLQISVQARELPTVKRKPTYLTVGVDVTSSMSAGSRLTLVRQALKSLIERLGPSDRFTLVALGGQTTLLVDEGSRAEIDQLSAAVDAMELQGAGNLADGALQTLLTAGRRTLPSGVNRRVVVISDSFGEFDPAGVRSVEQFLNTDAGRNLRLDVVDVGSDELETAWAELARRRNGLVVRATTVDRLRAALRQSLTGQGQIVARKATLTVTFRPEAVAAYRLFGHEPTVLSTGLPQQIEFDLSAGQIGTVLYELQLRPGAPAEAATVALRWRDPIDGQPQEEARIVTRNSLGTPFERASPALQTAALAAATAARLRNSPLPDNVAPSLLLQWARRLERSRTVRGLAPWLDLLADMDRQAASRPAAPGSK